MRIFFIFFLLLLFNYINAQGFSKIRINPDKTYGGYVSEYFSKADFIPLETSKESSFGEVSQMLVTDSCFIITDFDTRCILFFTLNGNFLTKIQCKQNEYPTISILNKELIILNYNSLSRKSNLWTCNLYGNNINKNPTIKRTFDSKEIISIDSVFSAHFNSCFYDKNNPKDSIISLIEIYKNKEIYKKLFIVNQANQYTLCALSGSFRPPVVVEDGCFYVSKPLTHEIYRVNKDSAVKKYEFVFPKNLSYDIKLSEGSNKIDSLRQSIKNDWKHIFEISHIFFYKNLLFFKTDPKLFAWFQGSNKVNLSNFIYDTLSGRVTSIERIQPDSLTYYLPSVSGISKELYLNGLIYKSGCVYTSISSLNIFNAKEATKSKNPQYPPVLQEYFRTQNRKSNPVIVRMKLKE